MGMDFNVYAGPCVLVTNRPASVNLREFCEVSLDQRLYVEDGPDEEEFLLPNRSGMVGRRTRWSENSDTHGIINPRPKKEKKQFAEAIAEDLAKLDAAGIECEVVWAMFSYYS